MNVDKIESSYTINYTLSSDCTSSMSNPTFVTSDTSWINILNHYPQGKALTFGVSANTGAQRTGYITATVNGHTCTSKKFTVIQAAGGGGTDKVTWTIDTSSEIACDGADGSYHTDLGSSFDLTKLTVLEKETWMTDVTFGSPNAQGDGTIKVSCAALPASSQSRNGVLRLSYDNQEIGSPAMLTQVPCSTLNITYKITKSTLDPCGSNGSDEIGYYKWSGCDVINNMSFSHVGTRPNWIETL